MIHGQCQYGGFFMAFPRHEKTTLFNKFFGANDETIEAFIKLV